MRNKVIISFRIPLLTIILFCFFPSSIFSQEQTIKDSQRPIDDMVSKIKTHVDPEFVYEYDQTKFVPPNGKTLLIMGQTVESITEYQNHFSNEKGPGGWSAYWAITAFKGVTEKHKNDTGSSQNHQMLVDKFPNTVIQSAMWMVGKWGITENATLGYYDKVIEKYADWAKSINRPIYLRIGYEFDGPHNELEPKQYKRIYKRIVDILRNKGVNNIAFVWHSYASKPFKDYKLSDWYPGDEYVDWVAISVFGHAYNSNFGSYCDRVLEFAKQHKKPVMIAESNPVNGIEKSNLNVWDDWFVNYFSFIYNKNIKAVSFINENWQNLNIPGIQEWQDARLQNNEKISEAWFMETDKDYYLKQSPQLFELLGYK